MLTNTAWPQDVMADARALLPVTLAPGAGTLKAGQVMSFLTINGDRKWCALAREGNVANEAAQAVASIAAASGRVTFVAASATGANARSMEIWAAQYPIAPGTLQVNPDGGGDDVAMDSRTGTLIRTGDGVLVGSVDYATGRILLRYPANVTGGAAIVLDYRVHDRHGKSVPRGILMNAEVNLDAANDTYGTVAIQGDYVRSRLVYPGGVGDSTGEKGRIRDLLADIGLYAR